MGAINNLANALFGDDRPLEKRNIIDVSSPLEARMVSIDYFLKTGTMPSLTEESIAAGRNHNNLYINWNSNDALINTLDATEQKIANSIETNPELHDLLQKDRWTKQDRIQWEKGVSNIVNGEMDKIGGLNTYRSEGYNTTAARSANLNDLSHNIETGSVKVEYDCEAMSALEGAMLQKMDNRFLPQEAAPQDYKKSSNYFYAAGQGSSPLQGTFNHVYVVSSATGNVIEGTIDPSEHRILKAYTENIDPDYDFQDFVEGVPARTKSGMIYSSTAITPESLSRTSRRMDQVSDELYKRLPNTDDKEPEENRLSPTAHDSPPPEVQNLMEIKSAMSSGIDTPKYVAQFANAVQSLAQNGQLQNVIDWLQKHPDNALSQNIKIDRSITDNAGTTSTQTTKITLQF